MGRLQFAIKFSMSLFLLTCHLALAILFIVSFTAHSGKSTEAIAIGVNMILVVLTAVRLWYYVSRHRRPVLDPSRAKRDVFDERIFVGSTCLISLAGAVWVTAHGANIPDDFSGVAQPDVAAILAITMVWIAWSISFHLVWIVVQEENPWLLEDAPVPVAWPPRISPPRPLLTGTGKAAPLTSHPPRRGPYVFRFPGARLSAKMVGAVQHGTPPEMWDHTNAANAQAKREKERLPLEREREREIGPARDARPEAGRERAKRPQSRRMSMTLLPNPIATSPFDFETFAQSGFEVQRVRPAYNPRARQLCSPPPVTTTRQQWYITPGEAL